MPFAGITFLWFIGVVRDGIGDFEDKFFSSVFLGSGLLFLAMMFASIGGRRGPGGEPQVRRRRGRARTRSWRSARRCWTTLSDTYALRMAGVFMISLATIWLKTRLMPRWLVVSTYALAVVVLIAGDVSMWLTLAFPAWVLVVSVLALVRSGVIDLRPRRRTTSDQPQHRRRADLDGLAGVVLLGLGHVLGEQHHDAVVVLVEQRIGDHHAVARGDAVLAVGFESHVHHLTINDRSP